MGRHARERRPGDARRGFFRGLGDAIARMIGAVVDALLFR